MGRSINAEKVEPEHARDSLVHVEVGYISVTLSQREGANKEEVVHRLEEIRGLGDCEHLGIRNRAA